MAGQEESRARQDLLRALPGVDDVLAAAPLKEALPAAGHGLLAHHVRATIENLRTVILKNGRQIAPAELTPESVARSAAARVRQVGTPLPRVINGTGVVLHSGLGRAPLAPAAVEALVRAGSYSLLEVDREDGARHARDSRVGSLLQELTGAEASLVVNNNAAATLIMLAATAAGGEVICSRGEMVEIGGSFRIPDVMSASGCKLVEVGCTNRTHTRDYEDAITDDTAALLVVHTSNYRIEGFTGTPPLEEIAALGKERGIPVLHDLGSGSLLSPEELGLGDEPPAARSVKSGADVVTMSGDKLLGGPQCGIILGRKELVQRMRKHPLARALRIDKMTVAALEATLQLFLDQQDLETKHPVVRMLKADRLGLLIRARAVADAISNSTQSGVTAEAVELPRSNPAPGRGEPVHAGLAGSRLYRSTHGIPDGGWRAAWPRRGGSTAIMSTSQKIRLTNYAASGG